MKKQYLKLGFILFVILFVISGCSVSNVNKYLVNKNHLTIGIIHNDTVKDTDNFIKINKIINRVADEMKVSADIKYYNKFDEIFESLNNGQVDIILGNIVADRNVFDNYSYSFSYGYEKLYCITNVIDDITNIKFIDNNDTYVSENLSNLMYDKISIIKKKDKTVSFNLSDDINRIKKHLDDKIIKYYLCYKKDAIKLLQEDKENKYYINCLTNIEPDELVVVSKKENMDIIKKINKVILENENK